MNHKIFSISEAAKYLGVFPLTLRNWEKKGLIKSFRTPGRHRRFRKSDLDRVLGMGRTSDKLKESIKKLEQMYFENNQQGTISEIIKNLRNISEDI
jgi:excisionase family DNA binding protein